MGKRNDLVIFFRCMNFMPIDNWSLADYGTGDSDGLLAVVFPFHERYFTMESLILAQDERWLQA